jgi:hypothetical protein
VSQQIRSEQTGRGVEDTAGWGFLGLTLGIVGGFVVSVPLLVPLFPKPVGNWALTVMTCLVVIAMTIGGAVGYLVTRRAARRPTTAA